MLLRLLGSSMLPSSSWVCNQTLTLDIYRPLILEQAGVSLALCFPLAPLLSCSAGRRQALGLITAVMSRGPWQGHMRSDACSTPLWSGPVGGPSCSAPAPLLSSCTALQLLWACAA